MKHLVVALSFVLFPGCALKWSEPPIADFSYPHDSKIAIVNSIVTSPEHTHVGTTIFSNFQKTFKPSIDLRTISSRHLKNRIEQLGYSVEEISLDEWNQLKGKGHIHSLNLFSPSPSIARGKEKTLTEISSKTGYRAVIFISSDVSPDFIYSTNVDINNFGIYSRSRFGTNKVFIYYLFTVRGFSLDPPHLLGTGNEFLFDMNKADWKVAQYEPLTDDCFEELSSVYNDCEELVLDRAWNNLRSEIERFVLRVPRAN